MKKALIFFLSLLMLSVPFSCTAPAAQDTPSPSPTAQTTPAPEPTPEGPDYDGVQLPEPKSEKWESYDRIIFSRLYQHYVTEWGEPLKNKTFTDRVGLSVGEEITCGCWPFNENTSPFFTEDITVKADDMVFIDLQLIRQSLKKEIDEEYNKRLSEADKLLDNDAQEYMDGLREYIVKYLPSLSDDMHSVSYSYYRYFTNDEYIRQNYILDTIEKYEGYYDKQWQDEHGDLKAKAYLNALVDAIEYKHKVAYSLCKEELDYFNARGFDLRYYYDIRYEKCMLLSDAVFASGARYYEDSDWSYGYPRLRGFVSAEQLENMDNFELPNGGTAYLGIDATGFLADYCGITLETLPACSDEEAREYEERHKNY